MTLSHKTADVLIVEDDELSILLFSEILREMNVSCDVAINGKEALKKLMKETYDLVLLDIHMPEMNGFEVLKKFRTSFPESKTKIIIVSASVMKTHIEKYKKSGADDFISKPIDVEIFKENICRHISGENKINCSTEKKEAD